MGTRNISRRTAKPSRPATADDDYGLLVQASHLLHVGVASVKAHVDEGSGRPAAASMQAIVQAARRDVELWIDAAPLRNRKQDKSVPRSAYLALSVLMLMDALLADDDHDFDSSYCDPIICGLETVQEFVEQLLNKVERPLVGEAA
jgi:hypothetical protein